MFLTRVVMITRHYNHDNIWMRSDDNVGFWVTHIFEERSTLVPCDFDTSPLHSDRRRRYRQSKVGSLLVSPWLFVRQVCYERLKKNRLDATINAPFPRDVVKHAERNVCARGAPCNTSVWNESPLHQMIATFLLIPSDDTRGCIC